MSPKNTQAKIDANNRYNAKAYDRINIAIPKGRKAEVEAHAESRGQSINALVNTLLRQDMGISEAEWKMYTVHVVEKENIYNPDTRELYDDRESLHALDGLNEKTYTVSAENSVEAAHLASDHYERCFNNSRVDFYVDDE